MISMTLFCPIKLSFDLIGREKSSVFMQMKAQSALVGLTDMARNLAKNNKKFEAPPTEQQIGD